MCYELETGRLPRNDPTSKDELTRHGNISVLPGTCRNPIVIPVQTVIQGGWLELAGHLESRRRWIPAFAKMTSVCLGGLTGTGLGVVMLPAFEPPKGGFPGTKNTAFGGATWHE